MISKQFYSFPFFLKQDIAIKLQDFSECEDHKQVDACVVCILSHGEEGYIFGTDGRKILLDNVLSLFDNSHCKHLIGKPKIFIIQACRGGMNILPVCFSDFSILESLCLSVHSSFYLSEFRRNDLACLSFIWIGQTLHRRNYFAVPLYNVFWGPAVA